MILYMPVTLLSSWSNSDPAELRDTTIVLSQIKLQISGDTATNTEIRHREEIWI